MPYSGAAVKETFDGLLFDMDGTIIDSTPAVIKHWHTIGKEIGVSGEVILETSHGRRSIDVLRILAPEKANWDYICNMEAALPRDYADDAVEIPGARALLDPLIHAKSNWAIVTSGTKPLVEGWLTNLSLPKPDVLVTAESVENGKPDPTCYRMGRDELGLSDPSRNILVLEDSPAGIRAGKDAGCKVIGLVTSHTVEQVLAAEPDYLVKDLESVKFVASEGGAVTLEFTNLWIAAA